MSPFTPHICEEVWEKLEHNNFISLEKWPLFDESKIDEEAEAADKNVSTIISDIRKVMDLIKKEKANKIKIIVSPKWKYDFFKLMKEEIEKTRDIKELIQICLSEKDLRQHGKDITKLIPAIIKDPSKLPTVLLTQDQEKENLKDSIDQIKNTFDAEVILEKTEDSNEPKSRNASPGKPAILIE
jgi:leucyl-tRNA synthetase